MHSSSKVDFTPTKAIWRVNHQEKIMGLTSMTTNTPRLGTQLSGNRPVNNKNNDALKWRGLITELKKLLKGNYSERMSNGNLSDMGFEKWQISGTLEFLKTTRDSMEQFSHYRAHLQKIIVGLEEDILNFSPNKAATRMMDRSYCLDCTCYTLFGWGSASTTPQNQDKTQWLQLRDVLMKTKAEKPEKGETHDNFIVRMLSITSESLSSAAQTMNPKSGYKQRVDKILRELSPGHTALMVDQPHADEEVTALLSGQDEDRESPFFR